MNAGRNSPSFPLMNEKAPVYPTGAESGKSHAA